MLAISDQISSINTGFATLRTPSLMRTWMPNGKQWAAVTAATWTLCSQWELEDDFDLIRFVYTNNGSTAYTIQLAKVIASASLGNGTTAAQETARLSVRTRMLNAWSQGIAVLDWENTMGTQARPNRIRSDYLSADGLHPNDLGHSAMDQAVFRRVLAGICGIST